ncbi:peptide deformylase [uncultured Bradyrhizobium sp.]|uniref:peptide deformylase n=1 Tax=uncultured Bradyrhizobium sp. TaxID=199684 RepID=UPI0035CAA157
MSPASGSVSAAQLPENDSAAALPRGAEIVRIGHPALRNGTRNVPLDKIATPVIDELIELLRATLEGKGVGLAAPQIAVPLRLFVIEDTEERIQKISKKDREKRERVPFPFEAVINPIWRATSTEITIWPEGCLSIPGFVAEVPRYRAIEVEGFTRDGKAKTWKLTGWPARIFQHEIDHLDGRLYIDCMQPRTLVSTEEFGRGAPGEWLQRLGLD